MLKTGVLLINPINELSEWTGIKLITNSFNLNHFFLSVKGNKCSVSLHGADKEMFGVFFNLTGWKWRAIVFNSN